MKINVNILILNVKAWKGKLCTSGARFRAKKKGPRWLNQIENCLERRQVVNCSEAGLFCEKVWPAKIRDL